MFYKSVCVGVASGGGVALLGLWNTVAGSGQQPATYPAEVRPVPRRVWPLTPASYDSLFTRFSLSTSTIRNTLPTEDLVGETEVILYLPTCEQYDVDRITTCLSTSFIFTIFGFGDVSLGSISTEQLDQFESTWQEFWP